MEEKTTFNYWREVCYLTLVFIVAGIFQLVGSNLGLILGLFILCIQIAKIYDFLSRIGIKRGKK